MTVMENSCDDLKFVGRILDNVHEFIYYTATEEKIIDSMLFKRLQSIKQLSIANWVFPGSEHTRFVHSLGVMYIADKIACQLNLSPSERKIVRLAGLLHDIGHYPLSHVCEFPYKKSPGLFPQTDYCKAINARTRAQIDKFSTDASWQFMKRSTGCHHEQIGADIISNNHFIREVITAECGREAIDIISDMIVGNVERSSTDPLLVQILHSDLDADGIDYLMRDATFSGTSFGSFELDQLIGCMEIGEWNDGTKERRILCINPKGIAAADQYLINKFFSYSQVVFNKHLSITEWMAEQIVDWMQKNSAYFPSTEVLKSWVLQENTPTNYIDFTDNFFWASLQNILANPLSKIGPPCIQLFCDKLLRHSELDYVEHSELRLVANSQQDIFNSIQDSPMYQGFEDWTDKVVLFSERSMSKQAPKEEFLEAVAKKIDAPENGDEDDRISEDDIPMLELRRLMEGICIKEDNNLHLLCDDPRSLIQMLYGTHLVILRTFECPC